MTYRELLLQAELKLNHNDITLGEFEQMIAPLNREVDVLDKIRAEIIDFEEEVFQRPNTDYSDYAAVRHCLEIIDKYRNEVSK